MTTVERAREILKLIDAEPSEWCPECDGQGEIDDGKCGRCGRFGCRTTTCTACNGQKMKPIDRVGIIASALDIPQEVIECFDLVAKHANMKGATTREDEAIDSAIETVKEFLENGRSIRVNIEKLLTPSVIRVEYEFPPLRAIFSTWLADLPEADEKDIRDYIAREHPGAVIRKIERITKGEARSLTGEDNP